MKKASFLALATALLAGTGLAATLTVTPATTYQTIAGIGGAIFINQNFITGNTQYGSNLLDTLFKSSGISILRLAVRNNNGMYPGDLSGDSTIVAEAYKRNPNLRIMAASWTPPANLKANNSANGNTALPNTLALNGSGGFVYSQFGGWWKQSLQQMAQAGIKPTWISFQNELDYNTSYQSCLFGSSENSDTNNLQTTNPGFESGTSGWTLQFNGNAQTSDATFSVVSSAAHSGTNAGEVVVNHSYGPNDAYWIQLLLPAFNVQPKTRYTLSFWAKAKNSHGFAAYIQSKADYSGDGWIGANPTQNWTRISGDFTTDSVETGNAVQVALQLDSADTYDFDDFKVNRAFLAGSGPAFAAVADSIATLGNSAPLMLGPEVTGIEGNNLETYASMVDASRVAAWSFHLYQGDGFDFTNPPSYLPDFDSVSAHLTGKPMFMTELYNNSSPVSPTDDFYRLAWLMQEGFTRLDLSAWVYWDYVYANGSMVVLYDPTQPAPGNAPKWFSIKPTFYALTQYSRFVQPNWKRISAADAADTALKMVAFTSAKGDSVSIVVVNPYSNSVSATPTIVGFSGVGGSVWTTSASLEMQNTGAWKSGTSLSFPAKSVTTLVGALGPTSLAAPGAVRASLSARILGGDLAISGAAVQPRVLLSDALGQSRSLAVRSVDGQWEAALPQGFHGLGLFQVRAGDQRQDLRAVVP
jgi:O-glycosyl hydrolase